jgi:hypothetical protein
MSEAIRVHKSSVMFAITMIRPMFQKRGCDVAAYSDEQLTDALLDAYAHLPTHWLSPEHVSRAFQRLSAHGSASWAEPSPAEASIGKLKLKLKAGASS